ncbi:glycosyl transferase family protein [Qipengyuania sphaerica]|uniref:glycosyl transferase family protein n=1 Tax=Qipengyuania sphaerica TaxID=2867243 RepID=UPI001FFCFC4E|nr:glycosyl transferase family protein [Qipengyuania sphaerica]
MLASYNVVAGAFAAAQLELLLFAAVFFAIGLVDEVAVDLLYLWNRMTGRIATPHIDEQILAEENLSGMAALFIPAWQEADVIGPTLSHALEVWQQKDLRIYVGCYRNDAATIASVSVVARGDDRVRLVVVGEDGPTCKAHCLNRLYAALREDETRRGKRAHMVVLHDAEDMVDAAALPLLDHAIWNSDFVQLPVMALPPSDSRWIASHYSDEFAEAHAKAMVVRDRLGCAIPGAGVGCAISRGMLARLSRENEGGPFSENSLTEDYELGHKIHAAGGRGRFLRLRALDGRLIATRAYFPSDIAQSVRQKTRWTHGIALQGWDRLGWEGNLLQRWMTLRDRRGPLAAILLAVAYTLVLSGMVLHLASEAGMIEPLMLSSELEGLLWLTFAGLVWRILSRAIFTAREYGLKQGLLAIPRVMVSNIIAIMSGRRALAAYLKTLRGEPVIWEKTTHYTHPALARQAEARA